MFNKRKVSLFVKSNTYAERNGYQNNEMENHSQARLLESKFTSFSSSPTRYGQVTNIYSWYNATPG
jgi:hypothetical protein